MSFLLSAIIVCLGLGGGFAGTILLVPYFTHNKTKSKTQDTRRDISYLGAEALIHHIHQSNIEKKELAHERERNPFTGTVSGYDKRTTWEKITNTYPKEKTWTDKVLGLDHDIWGNRLVEKKKWYEPDDSWWGGGKKRGGLF